MNVFNSIQLKNYGPFADSEFSIPAGLSVIYGLNKSGGKFSTNANAAGKSFLFSSIQEILFETPVVGQKQDLIKTGSRSLAIKLGNKDVVISRVNSKIEVKVNNKLKKFRTSTIARQYIKNLIPFTQEEYSTYIHLDARVQHPLVMGDSTARKRFFTSFFGLDKMDAEKKIVQAKLSELGRSKSAYDELYADYKKSTVDLIDKETNEKLKAKVKQGETILASLQAKNLELQEIKRLAKFAMDSQEMLAKLSIALQDDYSMESYDDCLATNKWNLKYNREQVELGVLYDQYKLNTAFYNKAIKELSPFSRKLLNNDKVKKAKLGSSRYLEFMIDHKLITKELVNIGDLVKPELVNKIDVNELDLLVLIKTYKHQLAHSSKFGNGQCEACGQEVTIKNPDVIKRRLAAVSKQLQECRLYKEYVASKAEYIKNKALHTELKDKLEAVEIDIAKYKPYYEANKELSNMPAEPEEYTGRVVDFKIYQRMYEEDKERMQLLAYARPHMDTIIACALITKEQIEEVSNADLMQARINRIQNTVSEIRAKISLQSVLRNKAKLTRIRLAELKVELNDEEPLKVILNAYSDKGMKRNAIQSISNTLMKTINLYAKSVFAEDYEFEFRWDTSQLSLLVHRKFGDKVLTSDVRKLSSAETKLFTIILVLALLTFVPSNKRSNILILDEPDANFSEETTEAFKKLLPVLLSVIPSIIVITPKTNERYENAHNFTVVKDKGVSTIQKGHPASLK